MTDFWKRFPATVSFLEPCEVIGVIEKLDELKTREGGIPQLTIRLDNGTALVVNATQARLLAELVRLEPDVGDRIRIIYSGQASTSAPGMKPAKEFKVAVQRPTTPTAT